jgi:exodeoxyribonuclease VII small subunit
VNGERPVDELGYEQARDELVLVVQRLESGAGTLEESLALWERGEALAGRCQQWLDGARERLEAASARPVPPTSTADGAARSGPDEVSPTPAAPADDER